MVKMIENEPKSVKNRMNALIELYNYLKDDSAFPNGKPVKWTTFTRDNKVSATFPQAIKKLGIVKQTDKQGSVDCYKWMVDIPTISTAAQVLKVERQITDETRKKKEKKDLEKPAGPRAAIRWPIVIKFRSIFYVK